MTFIQLSNAYPKHHQKVNTTRSLNSENLNHLKENLGNLTWTNVLASQDVNISFDIFWNQFTELYNQKKFNRNLHKICNYMTQGLLVSSSNKISLLKTSILNPTPQNKLKYKNTETYIIVLSAPAKNFTMKTLSTWQKRSKIKHGKSS